MKRHLSLILAMLLIIAALPAMSVASADDIPTVTVLQPIFNNYDPSGTPIQKEFLAKLNEHLGTPVNLDFTYYASGEEYEQKLKMAINAADLTWDIIYMSVILGADRTYQGAASEINAYGTDGFYVNLMEHKDDMPNLFERIDQVGTLFNYMYDADGNLYFAPAFTENQGGTLNAGRRGPIIDQTAFDENSIPYPTTLDELYEAAKKLKEIYPDSVPIVSMEAGARNAMSRLDEMAFCTRWRGNLGFNGTEYVVEATQDGFRKEMIFGNKLYKEGLIAADYAAWDNDMFTAATKNGESFIFLNMWSTIEPDGTLSNTNYGVDGHTYLNIAYAIAENEGGWWEMRGSMKDISATSQGTLVINQQSKNIDLACKVVDYLYTEECHNLLALGIQGESWDYDKDGTKVFIGDYLNAAGTTAEENPRLALGLQTIGACSSGILTNFGVTNTKGLDVKMPFLMPDRSIEWENSYLFGRDHWTYDNMEPENCVDVALPAPTAEDMEEVNEIGAVLWTYTEESMPKFYTGEWDPNDDDTWNAFVEQCKAYGSDRMCEIYNKYIEGIDFYPGKTAK